MTNISDLQLFSNDCSNFSIRNLSFNPRPNSIGQFLDLQGMYGFHKRGYIISSQMIQVIAPILVHFARDRHLAWVDTSEVAKENIEARFMSLICYTVCGPMHYPC